MLGFEASGAVLNVPELLSVTLQTSKFCMCMDTKLLPQRVPWGLLDPEIEGFFHVSALTLLRTDAPSDLLTAELCVAMGRGKGQLHLPALMVLGAQHC